MPKDIYTISELASEFDITPRTIRFYEEKGLLKPEREGQKRLFRQSDRVRLILILRGRRCGLTLEESGDIIDMYETGQNNAEQLHSLLGKIEQRRAILQSQLVDIRQMLEELDAVQARCEQSLQSVEEAAIQ
jgi:DNA-binding transcriptional MerR regulator